MSRFDTFLPPSEFVYTGPEIEPREPKSGIGQSIGAAIKTLPTTDVYRGIMRLLTGGDDPSFVMTPELLHEAAKGLPDGAVGQLADARSAEDLELLRQQQISIAQAQGTLARAGWGGKSAAFLTSVGDPLFWAATTATGGLAGPELLGGSALGKFAASGLINATAAAEVEAFHAANGGEPDLIEPALRAFAGTLAFHGGAGAIGKALGKSAQTARLMLRGAENSDIEAAMGAAARNELTPETKAALKAMVDSKDFRAYAMENQNAKLIRDTIGTAADELGLDQSARDRIVSSQPQDALDSIMEILDQRGTSLVPGEQAQIDIGVPSASGERPANVRQASGEPPAPPENPKVAGDFFLPDGLNPARAVKRLFGWIPRASPIADVGSTGSDRLTGLLNSVWVDPLAKEGNQAVGQTMMEFAAKQNAKLSAPVVNALEDGRAEWIANTPVWKREAATQQFYEEVGKAMALPKGTLGDGPVRRAAEAIRKQLDQARELMVRHGVEGSQNIIPQDDFFPRSPNLPIIEAAIARHGYEDFVDKLWKPAIAARHPELDPEALDRLANWHLQIMRSSKVADYDKGRLLLGHGLDTLYNSLKTAGIDETTTNAVLRSLQAKGGPNITKARLDLDEFHTVEMPNGESISMADMFDRNAMRVVPRYIRSAVGQAAKAELLRAASAPEEKLGLPPLRSMEELKNWVWQDAQKYMSKEKFEKRWHFIDLGLSKAMGIQTRMDGLAGEISRTMTGVTGLVYRGGFQLSHVPSLAGAAVEAGHGVLMDALPAYADIIKNSIKGRFDPEMFETLQAMGMGYGDATMHSRLARLEPPDGALARNLEKVNIGLDKANRVISDLTGFTSVLNGGRAMADISAQFRLIKMALSELPIAGEQELGQLGLKASDVTALGRELRKPGVLVEHDGAFGRPFRGIDFDKMDPELGSKLSTGIGRWSNRVIQNQDIGAQPFFTTGHSAWLPKPLADLLFQFRGFALRSYEKQLLYRLQRHNVTDGLAVLASTLTSGLLYTARQHLASLGKPEEERQDFMEKALSGKRLAAGAIIHSGMGGIVMPLYDMVAPVFGGDQIFSMGRTAQIGDPTGIPSLDLVRNAFRAVQGGVAAAKNAANSDLGRPLDRETVNAAFKLTPLSRIYGIQQFFERQINNLPTKRELNEPTR